MQFTTIDSLSPARLRGTCLVLEKSHLYASGKLLRHPLTLEIVARPNSHAAAVVYCRQHQCSWKHPEKNVDFAALEEPI